MGTLRIEDEEIILLTLEKEYCGIISAYNQNKPTLQSDLQRLNNELKTLLKRDFFFSENGREFLEGVLYQSNVLNSKLCEKMAA